MPERPLPAQHDLRPVISAQEARNRVPNERRIQERGWNVGAVLSHTPGGYSFSFAPILRQFHPGWCLGNNYFSRGEGGAELTQSLLKGFVPESSEWRNSAAR